MSLVFSWKPENRLQINVWFTSCDFICQPPARNKRQEIIQSFTCFMHFICGMGEGSRSLHPLMCGDFYCLLKFHNSTPANELSSTLSLSSFPSLLACHYSKFRSGDKGWFPSTNSSSSSQLIHSVYTLFTWCVFIVRFHPRPHNNPSHCGQYEPRVLSPV